MTTVNENESLPITITFDSTPSSVSYFVWDFCTAKKIIADTTVTAAASVSIEIPPAGTAITCNDGNTNNRQVVVTANYSGDSDKQTVTTFDFTVTNINGVT